MGISDCSERAEELLRGTASRVTRGRIAVLAALMDSKRALTHHEVETRLDRLHDIDRVTVYRVLEWLTENGLAHRLSGDDRVWRFTVARKDHDDDHPHFKCTSCGEMICLANGIALPRIAVPSGYKGEKVEITVTGRCSSCAPRKRTVRAARKVTRRTSA